MTWLDTAVMRAIDPSLQIGEKKGDHRQMLLSLLWITPGGKCVLRLTNFAKPIISLPAVSANDRARRYIVFDKCCKRIGVAPRKRNISLFNIRDNTKPEAASISEFLGRNAAFVSVLPFRAAILGGLARPNLNGANYRRLMMNSPPFAPCAAANATFVYFDGIGRADSI